MGTNSYSQYLKSSRNNVCYQYAGISCVLLSTVNYELNMQRVSQIVFVSHTCLKIFLSTIQCLCGLCSTEVLGDIYELLGWCLYYYVVYTYKIGIELSKNNSELTQFLISSYFLYNKYRPNPSCEKAKVLDSNHVKNKKVISRETFCNSNFLSNYVRDKRRITLPANYSFMLINFKLYIRAYNEKSLTFYSFENIYSSPQIYGIRK